MGMVKRPMFSEIAPAARRAFFALAVFAVCLLFMFPVLWLILTSLRPVSGVYYVHRGLEFTLGNFAEVLRAVEPAIILTPAAQYRVEILNHLSKRLLHIVTEFLTNPLPHMVHRLGGGKRVTENFRSPVSGRFAHKMDS